jgi:hypothetical protein
MTAWRGGRRRAQPSRYLAGQLTIDLQQIVREIVGSDRKPPFAAVENLEALAAIRVQVDELIDQEIVAARSQQKPASWARIGEALGITGQAAGQRARARHLPVTPVGPERLAELVDEGRRITGTTG